MAAANWTAIENALQLWVKNATGYDNRHCYWEDPNVGQPTDGQPYATLEMLDRPRLGATTARVQTDHLSDTAGTEIELESRQTLDCGFRVQVYAPPARGLKPGTPRGSTHALAVAGKVQAAIGLQSVNAALDAVGVSIYDLGALHSLPSIKGTDFEGRAVLECRFYVSDSVSERTGYVQTVQVTDTPDATTQTITLP